MQSVHGSVMTLCRPCGKVGFLRQRERTFFMGLTGINDAVPWRMTRTIAALAALLAVAATPVARPRSASARDSAGSGGVAPWCTERGASFETTAWCTGARKHAQAERMHNPDGRRLRGEPDAGNPPVRFDVAGAGDGVMATPKRARSRKRRTRPRGVLHTTAPVPDPTAPTPSPIFPCADFIQSRRRTRRDFAVSVE